MTRCSEVRDRLLDADPGELEGRGSSPVAAHVRACPACRARARRILDAQAALDGALSEMAAGVAVGVDPAEARSQVERRRRSRRRVVWGVVAPLAAAAVGAVALFGTGRPSDPGAPMGTVPTWALPGLGAGGSGTVVSAGGEGVAVLPTRNPDITVVWFIR